MGKILTAAGVGIGFAGLCLFGGLVGAGIGWLLTQAGGPLLPTVAVGAGCISYFGSGSAT